MVDFFEDGLGCFRHQRPRKMKLVVVGEKDGSTTEYFSCPKCFQILPATTELKEKLQTMIDALAAEKKKLEESLKPATAVITELEVKKEEKESTGGRGA